MPYILVRNSPNNHVTNSCRVAEEAYRDTITYIDNRFQWNNRDLQSIRTQLLLSGIGSSRLSTTRPPCEVLNELNALDYSVIEANTDGETTVWTLQRVVPYVFVRTTMNKKKVSKTYINSSFRWTPAEMEILKSRLDPLKCYADENRPKSLLSTRRPSGEVLHALQAFNFSVVAQIVGVTTGEWALQGLSHQIFVRNKMNMEIVPIPSEDVTDPRRVAEITYIDSSFQWTPEERDFLNSQQGLGPLTFHSVDMNRSHCLLSTPRPHREVLDNLNRGLDFAVVDNNTVGNTTVWTLHR